MASSRVRWEDLDATTYENLCAVLISRLHADVRRIDGSGGDGGRDVQVPTANGSIIYEMKSFTGRISAGRRRQVEKSLARAAWHNPISWNLVVPIDPTPTELNWFERIAKDVPFKCQWLGRTWLDEKISAHRDIISYYLEGSKDEVIGILRELSQEQGALTRGASDAVDRMKALSRRLNLLDPHYSFGLSVDKEGSAAISVWPKYPGAEHDRPLTIKTLVSFPNTDRGKAAAREFQEAIDYGRSTVIDPSYVEILDIDMPIGMGGAFPGAEIRIGSNKPQSATDLRVQVRIVDGNGRTVAQLPFVEVARNSGLRGGDLQMCDTTGAINLKLSLAGPGRPVSLKLSYRMPKDTLPGLILPALKFLSQFRPPHSIVILMGDKEAAAPFPIDKPIKNAATAAVSLFQALEDIQRASGVYFAVPATFSAQELRDIRLAQRLLSGETVIDKWTEMTISSTAGAIPSLRAAVERGPGPLIAETEFTLNIAGQEIPLGFTRQVLPTIVVAEWPVVPDDASPETPVDITFQPGADDSATIVLIKQGEGITAASDQEPAG